MKGAWAFALVGLLAGAARAQEEAPPRALETFHRVSLVIASENIRSPISSFGHTFLVFHDDPFPEPDALAVDYAGDLAAPGAGVFGALFASIPGRYRVRPFRDVAFEYDDEDRDLWVYEVRSDQGERQALATAVRVQVERGQRYNFVTRNCSQRIHDLFLGSLRDFRCTPKFYSLPVDSIRALDRCGRIAGVHFQRSSLGRALDSRAGLDHDEEARWRRAAHHDDFPAQPPGARLGLALGELLNYRLPREGDPRRRTQLYTEKKALPATAPVAQPVAGRVLRPPSAIELTVSPLSRSATLALQPAERNFLSAADDPLRTSTLELLRGAVTFSPRGVRPSELVPFNLEALIAGNPLRAGLVRKVEVAFRDWRPRLGFDAWEAGLQLGTGLAASSAVADAAAFASVGLEASALEGDFAVGAFPRVVTQLSVWPARWLRARARYGAKLWHYRRFVHHGRAELVFVDRGRWALGAAAEAMRLGAFSFSAESTLAVFF